MILNQTTAKTPEPLSRSRRLVCVINLFATLGAIIAVNAFADSIRFDLEQFLKDNFDPKMHPDAYENLNSLISPIDLSFIILCFGLISTFVLARLYSVVFVAFLGPLFTGLFVLLTTDLTNPVLD